MSLPSSSHGAPVEQPAVVIRPEEAPRAQRGGGVRTTYLVTSDLGEASFMSGITEFDPGASLPFHSHNCDESVMVLEGRAVFAEQDHEVELRQGDTTWVPKGRVHRFCNEATDAMRILWVYGSDSPTRTLAETGETFPIRSAADHA